VSEAEVAALIDAYSDCIDQENYEAWPELFTESCVYQIISREDFAAGRPAGLIYCDSKAMLVDRVRTLRSVNVYEPHRYRHLTGRSMVMPREGGCDARTSYMVARISQEGDTELFSTGEYRDEIVGGASGALFKKRIVVCDSHRVNDLLALPL
jgi:anthranilate 1,2-dioxygenase small subunit